MTSAVELIICAVILDPLNKMKKIRTAILIIHPIGGRRFYAFTRERVRSLSVARRDLTFISPLF